MTTVFSSTIQITRWFVFKAILVTRNDHIVVLHVNTIIYFLVLFVSGHAVGQLVEAPALQAER